MVDDTIEEEAALQLKAYCEAFFYGANVKLLRTGDTLTEKISGKNVQTKLPENFLEVHKIT